MLQQEGPSELARLRTFYSGCQGLTSEAQLMLDSAKTAMIFHVLVFDDAAAQANLERERALAAVKIDKADVDLVVQELEGDRAVADRELRVQGGDVVKALRALVNA